MSDIFNWEEELNHDQNNYNTTTETNNCAGCFAQEDVMGIPSDNSWQINLPDGNVVKPNARFNSNKEVQQYVCDNDSMCTNPLPANSFVEETATCGVDSPPQPLNLDVLDNINTNEPVAPKQVEGFHGTNLMKKLKNNLTIDNLLISLVITYFIWSFLRHNQDGMRRPGVGLY